MRECCLVYMIRTVTLGYPLPFAVSRKTLIHKLVNGTNPIKNSIFLKSTLLNYFKIKSSERVVSCQICALLNYLKQSNFFEFFFLASNFSCLRSLASLLVSACWLLCPEFSGVYVDRLSTRRVFILLVWNPASGLLVLSKSSALYSALIQRFF